MTTPPNRGFGRRMPEGREPPRSTGGTPPRKRLSGTPRLAKQLGGIAFGVAIIIGLDQLSRSMMRQVGRSLDDAFVEQAPPGDPAGAIETSVSTDARLASVHRRCERKMEATDLTESQKRALRSDGWLLSTERRLKRSNVYIGCLATTEPQRFCDDAHTAHLVAATKKYFKLETQLHEEWSTVLGGPYGASHAKAIGLPYTREQFITLKIPSMVPGTAMFDGIRDLVTAGYVRPSDFGGFAGIGVPQKIVEATDGVERGKATCE